MDTLVPSLFIGSSSEGLPIAHALQAELDPVCEPLVWSQGVFEPTGTTMGSLLEMSQTSDFAALVLTPDDSVVTRGAEVIVARDNVVFELGLFLGALGSRRVFIIQPRDPDLTLPSDLAGVTRLNYRYNRRDQNLQAAIGPAAARIRDTIASEGPRRERELLRSDQEAARFWLKYGGKVPQVKDAARRILARLPERTLGTLEMLAASLDKDLVVSSFGYLAQDAHGATYPERAVLMARRSWATQNGPRLGIGLGQSVTPDPHSKLHRPFWGIYAADQDILNRLRESCGPNNSPWHPWALWEYLSLDPPDEQRDLLAHYATAIAEHARLCWEENIYVLDRVIGHAPF